MNDKDWPVVKEHVPNACWACYEPLTLDTVDTYLTVWGGVVCRKCSER